jgi:CheY-like chemotaxis protein
MAELLLVDDDLETAELLAEILRMEGHQVHVGGDGTEGLAYLASHTPELVLLDVEMPVLTGPAMARLMFLHDAGLEAIPVLLLSGVLELPEIAASVGTRYFLAKPYTLEAVIALVARALAERARPVPPLEG